MAYSYILHKIRNHTVDKVDMCLFVLLRVSGLWNPGNQPFQWWWWH